MARKVELNHIEAERREEDEHKVPFLPCQGLGLGGEAEWWMVE